jgi:hypothetical protein
VLAQPVSPASETVIKIAAVLFFTLFILFTPHMYNSLLPEKSVDVTVLKQGQPGPALLHRRDFQRLRSLSQVLFTNTPENILQPRA